MVSYKDTLEAIGKSDKKALETVGQLHGVCKNMVVYLMIVCTLFTITFRDVWEQERSAFKTRRLHYKNMEEQVITHQMTAKKIIPLKLDGSIHSQTGIAFFLHMHRSGGTTINYLFREFKKYPENNNGNPWKTQPREIIQFWDYGKEEFNNFLQNLTQMKVKFVAFEWNYFKHFEAIDTSQIRLLTSIRDPYARYVSNMFANNANRKEISNPIWWMNRDLQWNWAYPQHFWVSYNKPNYYVRMMNGFGDEPHREVNQEHLETAKRNLDYFDVVIILEIAESFCLLRKFGVKYEGGASYAGSKNRKIGMTQEQFKNLNELDYEFYEYARNISLRMLNDSNIVIQSEKYHVC